MSTQPEALRLAEYMDHALNDPKDVADAVSAELRRLHEENGRLRIVAEMSTLLLDQRSALLEALRRLLAAYSVSHSPEHRQSCWDQARAAIKAVDEAKKG